jgi:O-antigen/teichoic acid export membrane protein
MMLSDLMNVAYTHVFSVILGAFSGLAQLGLYLRAEGTKDFPVNSFAQVCARVAFPVFSKANNDANRLRRGVATAVVGSMLINAPILLGLAAVADPFVRGVFGAQWTGAIPLLQILSIAGVLWPLHVINLNVLKALGYSNLFFRLEIVKKLLGTLILIVGISTWGVFGLAWGHVVVSVSFVFINCWYTSQLLGYGTIAQLRDCLPILIVSTLMSLVVYAAERTIEIQPIAELLILVLLGGIVYVASGLFTRITAFRECVHLLTLQYEHYKAVNVQASDI